MTAPYLRWQVYGYIEPVDAKHTRAYRHRRALVSSFNAEDEALAWLVAQRFELPNHIQRAVIVRMTQDLNGFREVVYRSCPEAKAWWE